MPEKTPHSPITCEDLLRLESKMDAIIDFFNIGKHPKRSPKQINDLADAIVFDLQKKRRKPKK